ncbi:MAG: HEAT repeat domain-containing protein [Myxococcota bacterium]|jgi:HEAT repeat protein|nr:HEAT repeat domain-containing protein [Myxococcota bacterium]
MNTRARQLVEELDHPLQEQRKAAADALLAMGPEAEPALSAKLRQETPLPVRRRVLIILCELKAAKAIPALLEYISKQQTTAADDTRGLAMQAVAQAVQPKHRALILDALLELRRDQDPTVRAPALEAIARLGDAPTRKLIEASIQHDADAMVREAGQRALRILDKRLGEVEQSPHETQSLVYKLASSDAFQREMAVDELIKLELEEALPIFLEASSSMHPLARKSGLIGLGRLGDERAVKPLLDVLAAGSSSVDERVLAMRALEQLAPLPSHQHERALALLSPYTKSDDPFLNAAALAALGGVEHPQVPALLAHRLRHPEPFVREAAALALAEQLNPSARHVVSAVAEALDASTERCRSAELEMIAWPPGEVKLQAALLTGLRRMVSPSDPLYRPHLSLLVYYMGHPGAGLRSDVSQILQGWMRSAHDLPSGDWVRLASWACSPDPGIQRDAWECMEKVGESASPGVVDALDRLGREVDTHTLHRAVAWAKRLRHPGCRPFLERVNAHYDAELARAAAAALTELG